MDIVDRIREYIKVHKITQRMFADLAGINCTTLIRGLQRKTQFRPDIKKRIEKVLKEKREINTGQYEGCNPPQSCFECPLPDCNNNKLAVKAETEYLQAGTAKDYVQSDSSSRQYDTSLHFCRKYNLLL